MAYSLDNQSRVEIAPGSYPANMSVASNVALRPIELIANAKMHIFPPGRNPQSPVMTIRFFPDAKPGKNITVHILSYTSTGSTNNRLLLQNTGSNDALGDPYVYWWNQQEELWVEFPANMTQFDSGTSIATIKLDVVFFTSPAFSWDVILLTNPRRSVEETPMVATTPLPGQDTNIAMIVGLAVGGIVVGLLACCLWCCCCRRRKNTGNNKKKEDSDTDGTTHEFRLPDENTMILGARSQFVPNPSAPHLSNFKLSDAQTRGRKESSSNESRARSVSSDMFKMEFGDRDLRRKSGSSVDDSSLKAMFQGAGISKKERFRV